MKLGHVNISQIYARRQKYLMELNSVLISLYRLPLPHHSSNPRPSQDKKQTRPSRKETHLPLREKDCCEERQSLVSFFWLFFWLENKSLSILWKCFQVWCRFPTVTKFNRFKKKISFPATKIQKLSWLTVHVKQIPFHNYNWHPVFPSSAETQ